jgi:hypothetical protein
MRRENIEAEGEEGGEGERLRQRLRDREKLIVLNGENI